MTNDTRLRQEIERKLSEIKPVVERFHAIKVGKNSKYPIEIKSIVIEAVIHGVNPHEISNLLGIKLDTLRAWIPKVKRKSEIKVQTPEKQNEQVKVKELNIVPDAIELQDACARVIFPNQILIEIPIRSVGVEFFKNLMSL